MRNFELESEIEGFLKEDEVFKNLQYFNTLPKDEVSCVLKIKDDLILAGIPYFEAAFNTLAPEIKLNLKEWEGNSYSKGTTLEFKLPFNVALTGERIALNLLQRASSIATYTQQFVKKLEGTNIKLLDTRKTTPGLRTLEKYATQVGGAKNHRFSQLDVFMIKDNHKSFFGGVKGAFDYFKSLNLFYNSLVMEIHTKEEFIEASELGIKHLMLDNFSPEEIKEIVKIKKTDQTLEASGGITLSSIEKYRIEGLDAISVGSITYAAPAKDISLKYGK